MMQKTIACCYLALFLFACRAERGQQAEKLSGTWRAELLIETDGSRLIPFFLEFYRTQTAEQSWVAAVINGSERIVHHEVQVRNDSVFIENPVFNSRISAAIGEGELHGMWQDFSRPGNYVIPFRAHANRLNRFEFTEKLTSGVQGRWKVVFKPGTEKSDTAIGEFQIGEDLLLRGTFLTETGDYRFLEGGYDGRFMKLSAFDGSHAFLFEAELKGDSLQGTFFSGNHWKESFTAWRDEYATLRDPYQMVQIKDEHTPLQFPVWVDTEGASLDLNTGRLAGMPLIIQIMGSWCPNCMDETLFLSRNYEQIRKLGIELVAVAFERQAYPDVLPVLRKYRSNLNVLYPIVYGGSSSKDSAALVFPQINDIPAFPTTLFLDSEHRLKAVHTGFSGPGTGRHYDEGISRFWQTLETIRVSR